jgi:hypothetical protein
VSRGNQREFSESRDFGQLLQQPALFAAALSPLPAFKTSIGLHTPYLISQIDFAEAQLRANKHINLVTLTIGANDLLLVLPQLESCGTNRLCLQSILGPVLQL